MARFMRPTLVMAFAVAAIPALSTSAVFANQHQMVNLLKQTRGSSMRLCAPASATTLDVNKARTLVSHRIVHGFGFKGAMVTLSSASCMTVKLPHTIRWLNWLAADVSSIGRFGIGETVPSAKQHLTTGSFVRFKNNPVTAGNAKWPVVKVVISRRGIKGYTAKVESKGGYDYVLVDLTPTGSRTMCTFTKAVKGALAVVVLDHQVVTDEGVSVQICGGSILTGFPIEHTLDKPLGPHQIVADLHSGPLPVALTPSQLK